jgi:phosphate transport system substrate-binding protein
LTSLRPQLPKNRSEGKELDRRIRRILWETRKPYYDPLTNPIACIIILIIFVSTLLFEIYYFTPLNYLYTHIHCEQGTLTINGSTAIEPLIAQAAKDYHGHCSGANISINPSSLPHGGLYGLAQVRDGLVNIGTSDNFADTTELGLNEHQVTIAVFALVVNKDVTGIDGLTTNEIETIYNGNLANWSGVKKGLEKLKAVPIVKISRPPTSEVRAVFEKYVLGGIESVSGPLDSDSDIATKVCEISGAIGYIQISYAQYKYNGKCNLHILSIDSQYPSPNAVENNSYKFWNIEHMYTKGEGSALAQAFIDYMRSDDVKKIYIDQYQQYGYLNIDDIQPDAWVRHSAL